MPFRILHTSDFTIERVKKRDMLLIDAHSGAYAHGLMTGMAARNSFRGVFVAPNSFLLGLDDITFVSDPLTDQVYYEIKRFVELLMMNNPLIMEMLNMPPDSIRYRNGLFGILKPELFLSKLCARTYTEYAQEQLSKIQLLSDNHSYRTNLPKKHFSDFCYINTDDGSLSVSQWLEKNGIEDTHCGLSPVPHTKDIYRIYVDRNAGYKGIFLGNPANARIMMSDIPQGAVPVAHLIFDEREFTAYNREFREQKEREEQRKRNIQQRASEGYDSNAFMEIVRLLTMAIEIAKEGAIITRRPDAHKLLQIRAGNYSYSYLVGLVKNLIGEVLVAFRMCPLPPVPNKDDVQQALLEIRSHFADKHI